MADSRLIPCGCLVCACDAPVPKVGERCGACLDGRHVGWARSRGWWARWWR